MNRILLAIGILMPFAAVAQQVGKNLTTSAGKFIGFYEYTPPGYSTNPAVKYPLIIFLHGIGERGNGTSELWKVKREGIPRYIDDGNTMTFSWNGKTESFIVLSPQCASNTKWYWEDYHVPAMIKYAKENLRVDTNRIMITGLSMGGGGVWNYIVSSVANAKALAAAAPVCGPCIPNDGAVISNANLPVWAFHAANDTSATALPECSINAVANINSHHPANKALLTLYPDGRHFIWNRAWDMTHKYQDPNIFEWFLGQNKSLPPNKIPAASAGGDINVEQLTSTATLSAAASVDADGDIVRYTWKKIAGPAGGNLSNTGTIQTAVSGFSAKGTYTYQVQVVDDRVGWSYDTVNVNVGVAGPNPPTPPQVNRAPLSRAGSDQVITFPAHSTILSGIASSDPDGWLTGCEWTKIEGPSAYRIVQPQACETEVGGLVPGRYVFRLKVKDNDNATANDDIVVRVNNISPQIDLAEPDYKGKSTLLIFPTMASHQLNVSYSASPTGTTVMNIYNTSGILVKQVIAKKSSRIFFSLINVGLLPKGMYFLQATVSGNAMVAKPFIKE